MDIVRKKREEMNITQEQLAEKAGVSVRTIQRIEAGAPPKGYTLKSLSEVLRVPEKDLLEEQIISVDTNLTLVKLINISSLPFTVIPPLNIALPLIIMFAKKEFNPLTKQLVSIQILWTIASVVIFMLSAFVKNWFSFSNRLNLIVMILLVLINLWIIIRNAIELDRNGKLYVDLKFSII
ncbi:helix-turn-helix domain-containing protein [Salegentibacter sp. F14]